MSAESALRSGAGMVSLVTRLEHVPAALARLPEVMTVGVSSANQIMGLLEKISVIVIGPGLGAAGGLCARRCTKFGFWCIMQTQMQGEKP